MAGLLLLHGDDAGRRDVPDDDALRGRRGDPRRWRRRDARSLTRASRRSRRRSCATRTSTPPVCRTPRRARHGAARRAPRARTADGRGPKSARRTGSRRAAGSSRSPTSTTRTRCASGGGRPFRGMEVRIADPETDEELRGRARSGRSSCAAPGLFDGYHGDPEKTAEAMRGGWLHTGDLGVVDADGRVSYRGRCKDMLKVGGENVAALEIEAFLHGHPAVKIVQVVGVPDPRYVEVPAAFVELAPDAAVTEDELHRTTAAARSPRSRCPATSASSPSGRCPRRRSRSTGCARRSLAELGLTASADAAPDHRRRDAPRGLRRRGAPALARAPRGGLPLDAAAARATSRTARSRRSGRATRQPVDLLGDVVRRPRRREGVVRERLLPRDRDAGRGGASSTATSAWMGRFVDEPPWPDPLPRYRVLAFGAERCPARRDVRRSTAPPGETRRQPLARRPRRRARARPRRDRPSRSRPSPPSCVAAAPCLTVEPSSSRRRSPSGPSTAGSSGATR